jgi:ABC-type multidrug transport system fused ATPase/permease subunit
MRILLRLFGSLTPYRLHVMALLVCIAGVAGASLAIPTLIRSAVDDGLAKNSPTTLLSVGLAIAGVGLVRSLFNFGRRYLSEWLVNQTGFDFRNRMYGKIQNLQFGYHDQVQTGQLMSRCTEDISALSRFVGQGGIDFLNVVLLVAGILFLLANTSATLILVSSAPLVVLVLVTYLLQRRQSQLWLRTDRALGQVSATLQENLGGAQVVRAFAREEYEKEKFERANEDLFDVSVAVVSGWGFFWPTMAILVTLSVILMLWFGGQTVIAGTLALGELVAFNGYLALLAGPVSELGFIVNAAGEAVAGGQRIFEVLDVAEEIRSPAQAIALPTLSGRVTFESVSFAYQRPGTENGDRDALSGVSFEAEPNQVIALIGPTGSGKTSLVNLIPRFYGVTAGAVCVDGHDVRRVDLCSLRLQIGIVLQFSLLFSTTIRENIAYGRLDACDAEICAAAEAARADEFIRALPQGYDTVLPLNTVDNSRIPKSLRSPLRYA